ncbi:hypothetical protein [Nitriliruptor alkaliphilus]|uniref:hypothetical protein n=1 Tax=Nitriliruptor alkaliphilus TaxID=427918 RepID=UPI0006975BB4|nr:hypothetical protein [Nitriliruptor alkaliphilus]
MRLLLVTGAVLLLLGWVGLRFTDRLLRGGLVDSEAARRGDRDGVLLRGAVAAGVAGTVFAAAAASPVKRNAEWSPDGRAACCGAARRAVRARVPCW